MRSIWSGAISFGLIYIPVRLYNASESQELDFDLLRRGDRARDRVAMRIAAGGEFLAVVEENAVPQPPTVPVRQDTGATRRRVGDQRAVRQRHIVGAVDGKRTDAVDSRRRIGRDQTVGHENVHIVQSAARGIIARSITDDNGITEIEPSLVQGPHRSVFVRAPTVAGEDAL